MGSAPALAPGAATATGMAVGGTIGGTANLLVQKALNGEQEMSKVDVLIAIVNGAATQGRSILTSTSINVSGAAAGAMIKGENISGATAGALIGTISGAKAGQGITGAAKSIASQEVSDFLGAVVGSVTSEATSAKTQDQFKIL
ncbi:hypothetical protein [Pandoraea commovens]|uniref:Hemagglutinin-related protein n=1 Tax=Pandoraea commovens TaxID=2508289 RepID=A0A5E4Z070_9BURK|nr:hypothetical protein [Pandoraea commovens]VVE54486.1 hemagglutinin-related protein [Pandoraea commovens]